MNAMHTTAHKCFHDSFHDSHACFTRVLLPFVSTLLALADLTRLPPRYPRIAPHHSHPWLFAHETSATLGS
eukprot:COSAG03_NODE_342_length_8820_cov_66.581699_9_plen_71_part_00